MRSSHSFVRFIATLAALFTASDQKCRIIARLQWLIFVLPFNLKILKKSVLLCRNIMSLPFKV